MPLYEYKCSQCDELFEELRSINSRDALTVCGKCGAIATHVLSRFNTLGKPSIPIQNPKISQTVRGPGGAFIRIGPNVRGTFQVWNNRVENLREGVSIAAASEAKVKMRGNIFKNVSSPVEVTDDNE
jgi:putative FmdB family regulatory protein